MALMYGPEEHKRPLMPEEFNAPDRNQGKISLRAARGVRHGLLTLFLLEVKKRKEESREGVWREEMPRSDSSRIGSVWNFGERPEDGGQERLAQRNSGGDGSKRNDDDTKLDQ